MIGEGQILLKGNFDGKKKKIASGDFQVEGKKVYFPLKEHEGKLFDPFSVWLSLPFHSLIMLSIT